MHFEQADVGDEVAHPHKEHNGAALFLLHCLADPIHILVNGGDAMGAEFLHHGIYFCGFYWKHLLQILPKELRVSSIRYRREHDLHKTLCRDILQYPVA